MSTRLVRSGLMPVAALLAAAITLAACSSTYSIAISAAGNTAGNSATASGSTSVIGDIGISAAERRDALRQRRPGAPAWANSVNAQQREHQQPPHQGHHHGRRQQRLDRLWNCGLVQRVRVLAIVGEMSGPARTSASSVQARQASPVIGGNPVDHTSTPIQALPRRRHTPTGGFVRRDRGDQGGQTARTMLYCTENPGLGGAGAGRAVHVRPLRRLAGAARRSRSPRLDYAAVPARQGRPRPERHGVRAGHDQLSIAPDCTTPVAATLMGNGSRSPSSSPAAAPASGARRS